MSPIRTLADINRANRITHDLEPEAYGARPELKPVAVHNFDYPADYPTDPSQGLSPAGAKSLAEINRSNAAAYGPASSYYTPTNMVGDEKWRVEIVLASGEKKSITVEAGSGDEAQSKAMRFFHNVNHIVSSTKVGGTKDDEEMPDVGEEVGDDDTPMGDESGAGMEGENATRKGPIPIKGEDAK